METLTDKLIKLKNLNKAHKKEFLGKNRKETMKHLKEKIFDVYSEIRAMNQSIEKKISPDVGNYSKYLKEVDNGIH